MNIKPQEVTENGERSVRYKGSDGKYHNIAAGSQQGTTPTDAQTEQSVTVGAVTIESNKPTITVDELLADRFYKIDSENGGCLIATTMEDGEIALRIIGNSKMGLDSKVVETVVRDEQERWVLNLSGWAVNPVMTLLSDRDTLKELTLNHQALFEDFLNYSLLGSATYDNHGGYFGSFTQSENGWIICDKDVAGRNGTLTIAVNQGMGGRERTTFKTFRLSNYEASVGSFKFKAVNDKLVMTDRSGDIIWGFSVFKITGVLGTIVNYADETHVRKVNWNEWLEPASGDRILISGEDTSITINDTVSDEYYIYQTIPLDGKGVFLLEYLSLPDPDMSSGYSCYVIVNGKPIALNQQWRNNHGGM